MFFRPNNALLLAGTKLNSTYKSLELTTAKGGRKGGGWGCTPLPWAWHFTKTLFPAQRRLFVSHTFCLLIYRLNANTTVWICTQIERCIVNGPKVIIRFWWESGLSSASRKHLTTFCRSFFHYACLRLCSAIVHFSRSNCLCFVCNGWAAQALTALATLAISVE